MTKKKTHKLTKEMMDRLRGISIVSDTLDYTLDIEDVPAELTPVFTIKNLSVTDSAKIKELANKSVDADDDEKDANLEDITRRHIVGWKNLYDLSTGELFKFEADEDGCCSVDKFSYLPMSLKVKIYMFINSLSVAM